MDSFNITYFLMSQRLVCQLLFVGYIRVIVIDALAIVRTIVYITNTFWIEACLFGG
jgi:hypothetical protein